MERFLHILNHCPLFHGMMDEEILTVLHCVEARKKEVAKDVFIFHAGDQTKSMGLVLTGSLLIMQEDVWGHRNIMTKVIPGDFFAEPFAAVPGSILNVSVITQENSEILMLDMHKILEVCPSACTHHHRLVRNLVAVLANKTLQFNDKITHMAKRNTRDKLLSYLSTEAIRQGKLSFDIPYNRQQLADYLCVERAAMSVELSKLGREGVLKTTRKHFELYQIPENEMG